MVLLLLGSGCRVVGGFLVEGQALASVVELIGRVVVAVRADATGQILLVRDGECA